MQRQEANRGNLNFHRRFEPLEWRAERHGNWLRESVLPRPLAAPGAFDGPGKPGLHIPIGAFRDALVDHGPFLPASLALPRGLDVFKLLLLLCLSDSAGTALYRGFASFIPALGRN